MGRTLAALVLLLPLATTSAMAQGTIVQEPLPELPTAPSARPSGPPAPLLPGAPPLSTQRPTPQPEDRVMHSNRDPTAAGPAPGTGAVPSASPAGTAAPSSEGARVFCEQNVTFRIASANSVPERYRPFIGMFSDAAWTPQLCAALIVQNVQPDGTASIVYAYGPMGSNIRAAPGGVLNGTGIIQNDELRFQNSDGSQFAFKPLYSDLDGQLTTPKGQRYETMFKRTF